MKALSILALAAVLSLSACGTSEKSHENCDSTKACCDSSATVTDSTATVPADSTLSDTTHKD